ncbi:unnamed protein product [Rhizophagus irregularis]|uniref:Peptidase M12A domain-containing protein n=1 Tax=Rhizophagus irregularis TaxID=588596 RepID=A0A916E4G8_9GLOM|nr:unnamed protein product [Rhizophagus irregularis]CAB5359857.1 unnamed protein product [Rhizophagus irregularis]
MSIIPKNNKCCAVLDEVDVYSDVYTSDNRKLWDNRTIPYKFDKDISFELKTSVMKAMERIAEVSSIVFEERNDQKDYIKIVDKGGYWSFIGKQGGKQSLILTLIYFANIKKLSVTENWPHPIGHAMHELMHALGFHHEHCRPDRDEHIKILVKGDNKSNINYEKLEKSDVLCYGPYDFESIMHYSEKQGVKAKSGTNSKIGQRERLSSGDKLALNKLYPRVVFLFRKKIVLNRRNLRRLRRLTSNYLTYNLSKLPRQNTNNLTINNFFNGYPFDPDADPDADPIDSK